MQKKRAQQPPLPFTARLPTARLYPLLKRYQGEELIGVQYYRGSQRIPYQVFVCGHLLCDSEGFLLDPHLDLPQHSRRSGKAIFAIDPRGQMWLTFDQKYGKVHHSSLVAGGSVIAAGEALIVSGQLISISNESGHYHPLPESVTVALQLLRVMNVKVDHVERYIIKAGQPKAIMQPSLKE